VKEGQIFALALLLLFVAVGLLVMLQLLRVSRPLLRQVFSRERGVLVRRALIGLADIAFAVFGAFFFGALWDEPAAGGVMGLLCLLLFILGLTLWLLAVLQFFGILFGKKEPAPEPPNAPPPAPNTGGAGGQSSP